MTRRVPEITEIALAGDLDLVTRAEVLGELERIMAAGPPQLLIDLSKVDFIDSGAVALLDWTYLQLDCDPARLGIASPNRQPNRILSLTRRQRSLPVYPSRESALAVLARGYPRPRTSEPARTSV